LLDGFVRELGINRFALYLHDFGSPIGARLAIKAPERVVALIMQNADIPYEDALGPKYAEIEKTWTLPVSEMREKLAEATNEETFREEFLNDVRPELAACIPPDLWTLHWSLMTPKRKEIAVSLIAGLRENRAWFPQYRQYLREYQPPTLIAWRPALDQSTRACTDTGLRPPMRRAALRAGVRPIQSSRQTGRAVVEPCLLSLVLLL
jgi:pimeloyl-ACP methyl ester carboxylesterase